MDQSSKPMGTGLQVGLFFIFVAVWVGLTFLLHSTVPFYRDGGWGMWPILAVGLVFVLITIDRVRYLYVVAAGNRKAFVATVQRNLLAGNVKAAIDACVADGAPMAKMVHSGLVTLHRPDDEVQEAVDEAALYELPRIEERTGYLAMMGNIATLLGLLGTIVGLITSFAGVSLDKEKDPDTQRRAAGYLYLVPMCAPLKAQPEAMVNCIKQNKATILARGISEAMHCTAFGLLVGILALLAFSVLNGRTQNMIEDVSEGTVHLVNLAVAHRDAMDLPASGNQTV